MVSSKWLRCGQQQKIRRAGIRYANGFLSSFWFAYITSEDSPRHNMQRFLFKNFIKTLFVNFFTLAVFIYICGSAVAGIIAILFFSFFLCVLKKIISHIVGARGGRRRRCRQGYARVRLFVASATVAQ